MLRHASQEYVLIKTELHEYNTGLKISIIGTKNMYCEKCFSEYKTNMKKTWLAINGILNRNKSKT